MRKIGTDVEGSKAQILDANGIELYQTDEVIKNTFFGRNVYLLKKDDVEVKLYNSARLWLTVRNNFGLDITELVDQYSHRK